MTTTSPERPGDVLAREFRAGDQHAFGELIDAYQERFYRVAYRVVCDPEDALDVVQESFVKIHARIDSWDGESAFASWATRVVTNKAIDLLRRKNRERKAWEQRAQTEPLGAEDQSASTLVAEEQRDLVVRVKQAIEALPPGQRAIVALRHYEGLSLKEIAEIRGCALGTVKSTLHQAFKNLRQQLGDGSSRAPAGRQGGTP